MNGSSSARALLFSTLAWGLAPSAALADDSRGATQTVAARNRGLPYTMVEVSGGVFALPAATVCPTSLDQCQTGEVSLALGIRNLYQFGRFGFGAGISWATTLRNDAARGDASLIRDHSRRYFLIEGFFRYNFVQKPKYEFYASASVGGVGVNDSWSVDEDRNPPSKVEFLGPEASTIGTLGVSVGPGVGGAFILVPNLSLGGQLRYENWILASKPKTSPLGDVASLSGRLDVFDLSLNLAYRLPI